MNITRVQWSGGPVVMRWVDDTDTSAKRTEFSCHDEPADEFKAAMRGLVGPAVDLLEIDREWSLIAVATGISISHSPDGISAAITLQRDLDGAAAPLVLTTPTVRDHGEPGMSTAMVKAVDEVMRTATRYLCGVRAQPDLFLRDPRAA